MLITHWDILLTPFYLLVIYLAAGAVSRQKIKLFPSYRYFIPGLFAKVVGAIALCLIYQFYYSGGDTTNYFESSRAMLNMLVKDPGIFFDVWLLDNRTPENLSYFDMETGYPIYWNDRHSFFVVRLVVPLCAMGLLSFIPTSILTACVSFSGIWALYRLFTSRFPALNKELAIALLFIPSVVFWGSGILKDSFTLAAIGWYVYSFYYLFIERKSLLRNTVILIISSYVMLTVKPYIFFAVLPGSVIWLSNEWLARFEHKALRMIAAPFLLIMALAGGLFMLTTLEKQLGLYTVENVLDRAVVVQQDLKKDYYEGNSFDIGDFDSSIPSILSKAPAALFAALFRPTLLDARNPVMFLSAIENTFILLLTVLMLLRLRIFGFFKMVFKDPLLFFSMLFALFFAFSVGLSISNFGSLVRLKIPAVPFFVSALFIMRYFYQRDRYLRKNKGRIKSSVPAEKLAATS